MSDLQTDDFQDVSIYPNPANNEIYIHGLAEGEVEFFDLTGRFVEEFYHHGVVDISLLEKGVYLIVLKDLSGNIVKVSKQIVE